MYSLSTFLINYSSLLVAAFQLSRKVTVLAMFKFFSRTRDRSSGHLKDKLGQDLFLFNKVWFLALFSLVALNRILIETHVLVINAFNFLQAVEHGFPPKPSAIAHDPELNLLAVGTSNGLLKMYPLVIVFRRSLSAFSHPRLF